MQRRIIKATNQVIVLESANGVVSSSTLILARDLTAKSGVRNTLQSAQKFFATPALKNLDYGDGTQFGMKAECLRVVRRQS
jgi:hypothetical protein